MKKLMIAAAIVCAAALSQAAQVQWDWAFASDAQIRTGWTAAGGSSVASDSYAGSGLAAYLIAYDATSMNQDTILTALRSGKTIQQVAGDSLLATSATDSGSKIAKVTWNDVLDEEAGTPSITAFEVVFNTAKDSVYVTKSDTFTGAKDPQESIIAFTPTTSRFNRDAAGTASFGSAGWYAIPEPTSGLLLLIGVAGLALRRRRA